LTGGGSVSWIFVVSFLADGMDVDKVLSVVVHIKIEPPTIGSAFKEVDEIIFLDYPTLPLFLPTVAKF
jgi:hypothetical protein